MNNGQSSAFPITNADNVDQIMVTNEEGLTKREYFAGLAFQGLMANGGSDFNDRHTEYVATLSVKYADALLAELEKTQS